MDDDSRTAWDVHVPAMVRHGDGYKPCHSYHPARPGLFCLLQRGHDDRGQPVHTSGPLNGSHHWRGDDPRPESP